MEDILTIPLEKRLANRKFLQIVEVGWTASRGMAADLGAGNSASSSDRVDGMCVGVESGTRHFAPGATDATGTDSLKRTSDETIPSRHSQRVTGRLVRVAAHAGIAARIRRGFESTS